MRFLKELEEFAIIDQDVSNIAIKTFSRHLYYLSEESIVLCLFSEKMPANEKNEMAAMFLRIDPEMPIRDYRANHIKFNGEVDQWSTQEVLNFVGERSMHLFELLEIQLGFLSMDAKTWTTNAEYLNMKEKLSAALVCVNDGSERVISTCKL